MIRTQRAQQRIERLPIEQTQPDGTRRRLMVSMACVTEQAEQAEQAEMVLLSIETDGTAPP